MAKQSDGASDSGNSHPLWKERFENLVRANAEKLAPGYKPSDEEIDKPVIVTAGRTSGRTKPADESSLDVGVDS